MNGGARFGRAFRFGLVLVGVVAPCASGCGGQPTPIRAAPAATSRLPAAALTPVDPLATPPRPSESPPVPFPSIIASKLDNGLGVRVVTRSNYPLVELRLVVASGTASDGAEPGVAALAGELLKAGGAGKWTALQLAERAALLGSSLDVETGRDSTQIRLAVTSGDFDAALDLMGAVANVPRFNAMEFEKLLQRELERVRSAAKSDPSWAGSMLLYRELFSSPAGPNPYAHFDAEPSELERLTLASCKRWYHAHFVPKNATLIVAGDVSAHAVNVAAWRVFSNWTGPLPATPDFAPAVLPTEPQVWLVDRPHSAQSQIYVAGLGPPRSSPSWPAVAVSNQILGGGVASRLFLDVREKLSLAYHTGSSLEEPVYGRVPIVLSAGTQTAKTDLALQALLEQAKRLTTTPPSKAEVAMATRNLSDSFLFRTETLDAVATLTAKLVLLGLPMDYFDQYRKALRQLDASTVSAETYAAVDLSQPVIVVVGDASRVADSLSHFARVLVVDPERGFNTVREVPRNEARRIGIIPTG
jgi:zinc protease